MDKEINKNILYCADNGDGTYTNPVIFSDYSDPDVIRVEDTYYLTASSFNYTPGLPILISKDLVNWELVNYATNNIFYDDYDTPQHAKGIWAPAIRYHAGEFYIYYGMPDEGIFMVKAKNPLDKWENPVLVLEGKGLIDPCPYWEEDKAYIVHGYARSRIGFKSHLGIFEMNMEGTKAISEDHIIYSGYETNPTIEGPKVYKRNDFYYIFAPAGGVATGWQTVLRSKNIYGPFEEKVVLRQGNTQVNGPHQGALVDDVEGNEWFLHFQDAGLYGRIEHLQPVMWENDWPVIGANTDENGCSEPVIRNKKPSVNNKDAVYIKSLEASDDFEKDTLALQWQWLGNNNERFYSLKKGPFLRLFAHNSAKNKNKIMWNMSNVLTQKLLCRQFVAETKFDYSNLLNDEKAGVTVVGGQYCYLSVNKTDDKYTLVYTESYDENDERFEKETVIYDIASNHENKELNVKVELENVDSVKLTISYSFDGKNFTVVDSEFVPSDHQWTGAKLGIFAFGTNTINSTDTENNIGFADFKFFKVERI